MANNMKDSEIEWIGEIPSDWAIGRISHRYNLTLGKMLEGSSDIPGKIRMPYLCAANLKWGGIDTSVQKEMFFSRSELNELLLRFGDVLITEGGSIGTTCIYRGEFEACCFQNSVIRARGASDADNQFLAYWMEFVANSGYLEIICNKATISHYTKEKVARTPLPLIPAADIPPIVVLLNGICSHIESAISTIRDEINVLEDYKRSLIFETVTKGLNPSVPMKDSGVKWIGFIPDSWKLSRLRYLASFESGATPSKDVLSYWDGDIPWVSSMEVKTDVIQDTSLHISKKAVASCSTRMLPAGTLVMVVRSGILQHTLPVAILGRKMTINQDIKALEFSGSMLPKYFFYFIRGNNDSLLNELVKDKTTVGNLSFESLRSLVVPVPPIAEQERLVAFLDDRCTAIDKILAAKREQLETLRKYRQSIIYEYVTGKRRVGQE